MNDYKINLRYICDRYIKSTENEVVRVIAQFLISQRKSKSIETLYQDFLNRQDIDTRKTLEDKLPDLDRWRSGAPFLTGNIQKEMIAQLLKFNDIIEEGSIINWYYFPYYNGNNFYPGVILNEDISLDYGNESHQKTFRYLFAFIFNNTSNPEKLFRYHFSDTFKSNIDSFNKFIYTTEKENKNLIEPGIKLWNHLAEEIVNVDTKSSLEMLLSPSGLPLLEFIHSEYKNAKPQKVAIMVRSLISLKVIDKGATVNVAKLHEQLTESLGDIGSQQAFRYTFNNHDDTSINSEIAKTITLLKAKLQ